jgi:glycine dehydrogenase subunit 2
MRNDLVPELESAAVQGQATRYVPDPDVPQRPLESLIGKELLREDFDFPAIAEVDVVRHFTRLSQLNYGVDTGYYPLGSCTMKYNPKVNEMVAALPGFTGLHPLQPDHTCQGLLAVLWELQRALAEIAGLPAVSLQPAAGAHGELTGMLIARAYHRSRADDARRIVLVPDSAHGTNPATAVRCGFTLRPVATGADGNVDLDALRKALGPDVAALMITNPNTLGLFEQHSVAIAALVHEAGGLLYLDGANMNAIMGIVRPCALGVDIMHFNLHKTFSTPHGGGGPGSGPVAVREALGRFLPIPLVARDPALRGFYLDHDRPDSIGKVHSFYGNVGVCLRAYAYIRMLGPEGIRRAAQLAVLNANYLKTKIEGRYQVPYPRVCKHEFVASAAAYKAKGVGATDIAKRLIDYGFHPPTIHFPLIVPEALMIEPTETESRATLDAFAEALLSIADEIDRDPDILKEAPHTAPVSRLDEAGASRELLARARRAEKGSP